MDECEVLVVGGGLTGLSCAAFLAWHGVRCTLVERHPGLLSHPRQRSVPMRSMELYRQIGLEPRIKADGFDLADAAEYVMVGAETLADREYRPVNKHVGPQEPGTASPCTGTPIDQDKVEKLLRDRATELGARILFGTRMDEVHQHGDGVTARLRDLHGAENLLRAGYLVAADGARSPIRHRLGIPLDSFGEAFDMLTLMIEADLRPALAGRTVHMAFLNRPRRRTFLMALDRGGLNWAFGTTHDPHAGEPDLDGCVALVRQAVGDTDLPVALRPQIPGTAEYAMRFRVGAAVAASYRSRRVFLIGDAAHLMPPTGGFGGATGVQDAHNLAWKLAMVLAGQAGDGLLDTYHDERRPVALMTLRQALARAESRFDDTESGTFEPIVDRNAVMMGYRYSSTAVSGSPFAPTPPAPVAELCGVPGTRAPHLPASGQPTGASMIDAYGSRFVLLAAEAGQEWVTAAHRLPIGVDAYQLGGDHAGAEAAARHGLEPNGAILVRPDGFVAWRGKPAAERPFDQLMSVLGTVLSTDIDGGAGPREWSGP